METIGDMDRWVQEHGLDAFHEAMLPGGAFAAHHKHLGAAWMQVQSAKAVGETGRAEAALKLRGLLAAEQTALEAKRAADAAVDSARTARIAIWVSVAALFLAAWPFIDLVLRQR